MSWMNEYDVEDAVRSLTDTDETPNLATGALVLERLVNWTNSNSDGWPYWTKPSNAAAKLQELLQAADRFNPKDCTEAELKKTLTPIKAFLTRQGADLSLELDTASSASRQHRIDTGRYLFVGEAMF